MADENATKETVYDEVAGKVVDNPDLTSGYVYTLAEIADQKEVDGIINVTYNTKLVYHTYTAEELEAKKKQEEEQAAKEEAARQEAAKQAQIESLQAQVNTLSALLADKNAETMTDDQAKAISSLFSTWKVGTTYKTNAVVNYTTSTYRALEDSTATEDKTPDKTPNVWKNLFAYASGLEEWKQPQGAHDAYAKSAKVTYNGKTHQSIIDANVWAPDVYGWEEVNSTTEPTNPDKPTDEWPEWKHPTGAHDAYAKGAKVTYNGKKWTSNVDANVWEPGVSQWTEYTGK